MTESQRQDMLRLMRKSDAIKRAQHVSDLYLAKALREIDALPDNKVKKSLRDIALYMGKRKF